MNGAELNVTAYPGLETLATAVIVLDAAHSIRYFNPAAENLFALSAKNVVGQRLERVFDDATPMASALDYASSHNCSYTQHDISLQARGRIERCRGKTGHQHRDDFLHRHQRNLFRLCLPLAGR